jgi:hypothetical protein
MESGATARASVIKSDPSSVTDNIASNVMRAMNPLILASFRPSV